ncbi:MAG: hypothetical protein AAFW73_22420 [Bacteroidota bacterium]
MRLFLFLLALISLHTTQAQNGTSLEEYRYLSKGYAYQMDLGLDATKEGYYFRKVYTASNALEFLGMYRNGQEAPQALLCTFPARGSATYLCLPNAATEATIQDQYQRDRSRLSQGQLRLLETALVELVYQEMGGGHSPTPVNAAVSPSPTTAVPNSYAETERFTARGGQAEPLVATARSAPSYPIESPLVTNTQRPSSYATTPSSSTPVNPPINQTVARAIPAQPVTSPTTPATTAGTQLRVDWQMTDRTLRYQAPVVTKTQKKGVVVIKVCVSSSGDVTTTKYTQRGSTTFDSSLISLALENAALLRFDPNAVTEQCGIVSYRFNL